MIFRSLTGFILIYLLSNISLISLCLKALSITCVCLCACVAFIISPAPSPFPLPPPPFSCPLPLPLGPLRSQEKHLAYCCFCTEERLQALRSQGEVAGYDRRCRALSTRQVDSYLQMGLPHTIRLKVERTTCWYTFCILMSAGSRRWCHRCS